jgi:hypothetical protein
LRKTVTLTSSFEHEWRPTPISASSSSPYKPRTDFTPRKIADAQSPQVHRPSRFPDDMIESANGKKSVGGYVNPKVFSGK